MMARDDGFVKVHVPGGGKHRTAAAALIDTTAHVGHRAHVCRRLLHLCAGTRRRKVVFAVMATLMVLQIVVGSLVIHSRFAGDGSRIDEATGLDTVGDVGRSLANTKLPTFAFQDITATALPWEVNETDPGNPAHRPSLRGWQGAHFVDLNGDGMLGECGGGSGGSCGGVGWWVVVEVVVGGSCGSGSCGGGGGGGCRCGGCGGDG